MFDHVGVVCKDRARAGVRYREVLVTLGSKLAEDHAQPDGTDA